MSYIIREFCNAIFGRLEECEGKGLYRINPRTLKPTLAHHISLDTDMRANEVEARIDWIMTDALGEQWEQHIYEALDNGIAVHNEQSLPQHYLLY